MWRVLTSATTHTQQVVTVWKNREEKYKNNPCKTLGERSESREVRKHKKSEKHKCLVLVKRYSSVGDAEGRSTADGAEESGNTKLHCLKGGRRGAHVTAGARDAGRGVRGSCEHVMWPTSDAAGRQSARRAARECWRAGPTQTRHVGSPRRPRRPRCLVYLSAGCRRRRCCCVRRRAALPCRTSLTSSWAVSLQRKKRTR